MAKRRSGRLCRQRPIFPIRERSQGKMNQEILTGDLGGSCPLPVSFWAVRRSAAIRSPGALPLRMGAPTVGRTIRMHDNPPTFYLSAITLDRRWSTSDCLSSYRRGMVRWQRSVRRVRGLLSACCRLFCTAGPWDAVFDKICVTMKPVILEICLVDRPGSVRAAVHFFWRTGRAAQTANTRHADENGQEKKGDGAAEGNEAAHLLLLIWSVPRYLDDSARRGNGFEALLGMSRVPKTTSL